ncbi:alpha/beta fold hydrolase [Duganella callida]|uniref:Alpha/beta hydrolase n=1 Tax=Duganella callida TaxID=2561932 RepID=A0A4Y9SHK1_9BURK|nr:alpha/beta hydrolase [Duganella callida]TFW19963.1 alpha/beta hydrolase [Duganella callida]
MTTTLATAVAAPVPSTTASTTFHWRQVDGVQLFYREAGPQDAPVIVLLHGYPSSSRMWDPLIPLLADKYHVIAPDYPGFGHSEAPPPDQYRYTFDHLAQTTAALLRELGVARYTLFMQDYGGPVGFRMALNAPDQVQAIIIQNANAYQEGLGKKWARIADYWASPAAHPEQVDAFVGYEGTRLRHLGNSPNPERYNPDGWDDEFAAISRPGQREIQAALLYDYRTNVQSYPQWQAWLRQHQPRMLVMWGRYDPSFIVPGAEGYKRDVPGAELHILDAGHFALDEKTDEMARLVRGFMARLDPAR